MWIFFDNPVLAVKARRLGNAILTEAMSRNGKIGFKSYDRFFPNQDTMPEGGLGNLVALPLQGNAKKHGNSVFVDEDFEPYPNQWEFLLNVGKLSEKVLEDILKKTANIQPLDFCFENRFKRQNDKTTETTFFYPATPTRLPSDSHLTPAFGTDFVNLGGLCSKILIIR